MPPCLPPGASGRSFSFAPQAPHRGLRPAPCCTADLVSIPIPPSRQGFSAPGECCLLPRDGSCCHCLQASLLEGGRSTSSAPPGIVCHGPGPGPSPGRATRHRNLTSSSQMETLELPIQSWLAAALIQLVLRPPHHSHIQHGFSQLCLLVHPGERAPKRLQLPGVSSPPIRLLPTGPYGSSCKPLSFLLGSRLAAIPGTRSAWPNPALSQEHLPMFFFRARISGDVRSSGAAGIWLCPLHNSTHAPQTSSETSWGGLQVMAAVTMLIGRVGRGAASWGAVGMLERDKTAGGSGCPGSHSSQAPDAGFSLSRSPRAIWEPKTQPCGAFNCPGCLAMLQSVARPAVNAHGTR